MLAAWSAKSEKNVLVENLILPCRWDNILIAPCHFLIRNYTVVFKVSVADFCSITWHLQPIAGRVNLFGMVNYGLSSKLKFSEGKITVTFVLLKLTSICYFQHDKSLKCDIAIHVFHRTLRIQRGYIVYKEDYFALNF